MTDYMDYAVARLIQARKGDDLDTLVWKINMLEDTVNQIKTDVNNILMRIIFYSVMSWIMMIIALVLMFLWR